LTGEELTAAQIADLTRRADISAPPPEGVPVALVLFGTNQQTAPVRIAGAHIQRAGSHPRHVADGSRRPAPGDPRDQRGRPPDR
jgi:hypothetical protein